MTKLFQWSGNAAHKNHGKNEQDRHRNPEGDEHDAHGQLNRLRIPFASRFDFRLVQGQQAGEVEINSRLNVSPSS